MHYYTYNLPGDSHDENRLFVLDQNEVNTINSINSDIKVSEIQFSSYCIIYGVVINQIGSTNEEVAQYIKRQPYGCYVHIENNICYQYGINDIYLGQLDNERIPFAALISTSNHLKVYIGKSCCIYPKIKGLTMLQNIFLRPYILEIQEIVQGIQEELTSSNWKQFIEPKKMNLITLKYKRC